jgi:hypothetical protein
MTNSQSLPTTSVWSRLFQRFRTLRNGSKIRVRRLSNLGKGGFFKSSRRRKAEKELEARMQQEQEWANDEAANKDNLEQDNGVEDLKQDDDGVASDNGDVFASNSVSGWLLK